MRRKIINLIKLLKARHSNYTIVNKSVLQYEELIAFIKECVNYNPSPLNIQPCRVLLLIGDKSKHIWKYIISEVSNGVHDRIKERLENSSNAYATLIFFYDTAATNDDAELFKIPKDELEEWSLQSSVMLMNFLWVSLSELGYAANIQCYNKVIFPEIKRLYNIPDSWKMVAQMPFGTYTKPAPERNYIAVDKQLFIEE